MSSPNSNNHSNAIEKGIWSEEEHDKFLVGLKMFPEGPWTAIAAHIGTRTSRQVQTHAQKYYEKVGRRMRGLRKDRKHIARSEHRLGEDMTTLCSVPELAETGVRIGQIRRGLKAIATVSYVSHATTNAPMNAESIGQENWTTALGEQLSVSETSAASLDWIDALFDDEELVSLVTADVDASSEVDSLQDVDDCYLSYLIEILDSSDLSVQDTD